MNGTAKASYGQPALVGGAVMGVLSALPFVYLGNACCCLWVVSGGVVAAYILQQNQAAPITFADGALIGLLAGLAGAVIHMLLSIPIDVLMGPFEREMARRIIDNAGEMPPWAAELARRAAERQAEGGIVFIVVRRVFILFFAFFAGAVFSTLGGVLGAAVFRKPSPPSTTIDV